MEAQEKGLTAKGEVKRIELDRARQSFVRRVAESKATVPHSYLRTEVDMTAAVEIQLAFAAAAGEGPVPEPADMIVKATALALREHPHANGSYRDGGLELYSRVNIGFGVSSEEGLVFPTIVDADRLDLAGVAAQRRRLSDSVAEGTITAADLAGGTFSLLVPGSSGLRDFDPIIHGGQAGMLGVGEIADRAVVRDGKLETGSLMTISLACDHRILYTDAAAALLATIRSNLEQPDRLA
jgi:pyruvate dehydrogenase E2 component (dihydrolipoamide acetyltransferase)